MSSHYGGVGSMVVVSSLFHKIGHFATHVCLGKIMKPTTDVGDDALKDRILSSNVVWIIIPTFRPWTMLWVSTQSLTTWLKYPLSRRPRRSVLCVSWPMVQACTVPKLSVCRLPLSSHSILYRKVHCSVRITSRRDYSHDAPRDHARSRFLHTFWWRVLSGSRRITRSHRN